jgi:hypothetical protein
MNFQYLFSSPSGDIPVAREELDRPLHVNVSEIHPALALEDYFESIKELLLANSAKILTSVIAEMLGTKLTPERIAAVEIRCEKVGTLYHVASLTVRCEGGPLKLCVTTAINDEAIQCLESEASYLVFLADTYHLTCLPKVFYKGEVVRPTSKGDATLSHSVQEWFEDYHEWHLSLDDSERQQITVWDMGKGYRTFSLEDGAEIHQQAAKILTLCYDFRTGGQINPWSHAAGDFVVKVGERSFSVKLTTVRGYEPLPLFREERAFDPLIHISCFFLNLTVRMRLDRLDGIGSVLWAESSILHPVVSGFFEALSSKEVQERYSAGDRERIRESLKSFTEDKIRTFLLSLLDHFSGEEKAVVEKHMEEHARDLANTMRGSL